MRFQQNVKWPQYTIWMAGENKIVISQFFSSSSLCTTLIIKYLREVECKVPPPKRLHPHRLPQIAPRAFQTQTLEQSSRQHAMYIRACRSFWPRLCSKSVYRTIEREELYDMQIKEINRVIYINQLTQNGLFKYDMARPQYDIQRKSALRILQILNMNIVNEQYGWTCSIQWPIAFITLTTQGNL